MSRFMGRLALGTVLVLALAIPAASTATDLERHDVGVLPAPGVLVVDGRR